MNEQRFEVVWRDEPGVWLSSPLPEWYPTRTAAVGALHEYLEDPTHRQGDYGMIDRNVDEIAVEAPWEWWMPDEEGLSVEEEIDTRGKYFATLIASIGF